MSMTELENFAPFRNLTDGGKEMLRRGLVSKNCPPAAMVLHKGQRISGAYFVLRGRLRVLSLAPNGTATSSTPARPASSPSTACSTQIIH